jgi:hypothetical protein
MAPSEGWKRRDPSNRYSAMLRATKMTHNDVQRDRYVYVIEDEDGVPCYIGVGKRNRMHHHIRDARRGYFGRNNRVRVQFFIDCLSRGFVPEPYKAAEDLTADEAFAYERILVSFYGRRDLGTGCLLNAGDGGHGPRNPAPSLRLRRSEAARRMFTGRPSPFRGLKRSKDFCEKISAAARNMSAEHRAKLSAAGRRRIMTQVTREKIRGSKKGLKPSAEARKNLSKARQGRRPAAKLTPEIVDQIRSEYRPVRGAQAALARKYGLTHVTVLNIIRRRSWRDHAEPVPERNRAVQTHCAHGHPLSGDNLYLDPKGHRICRKCRRARNTKHRNRSRAQSRSPCSEREE